MDRFQLNSVLSVDTEVWAVMLILEQSTNLHYTKTVPKNFLKYHTLKKTAHMAKITGLLDNQSFIWNVFWYDKY